jgi:hypothetical protein
LNEAEAESAETQTWMEFSAKCRYVSSDIAIRIITMYDKIIGRLVVMSNQPESWSL